MPGMQVFGRKSVGFREAMGLGGYPDFWKFIQNQSIIEENQDLGVTVGHTILKVVYKAIKYGL